MVWLLVPSTKPDGGFGCQTAQPAINSTTPRRIATRPSIQPFDFYSSNAMSSLRPAAYVLHLAGGSAAWTSSASSLGSLSRFDNLGRLSRPEPAESLESL